MKSGEQIVGHDGFGNSRGTEGKPLVKSLEEARKQIESTTYIPLCSKALAYKKLEVSLTSQYHDPHASS